jgi:hypothetical protein
MLNLLLGFLIGCGVTDENRRELPETLPLPGRLPE